MKIPKHMLAMTAIFKLNCDSIEQPSDTLKQPATAHTAANNADIHRCWLAVCTMRRLYFSVLNEKTRGFLLFLIRTASIEIRSLSHSIYCAAVVDVLTFSWAIS